MALTAKLSNFVQVVQKRVGMNKFVRNKSHTGSKFSKTRNNFGAIMRVRDCDCAPVLRFFDAASDGATANRQIPDRIIGQFFLQV